MKSIVEEASSVSKAIEQAWQRAGKPQEFKVKVFEEPERNMFGLTVKSAKIGLFYEEQHIATPQSKSKDLPPRHAEAKPEQKKAEPRPLIKKVEVKQEIKPVQKQEVRQDSNDQTAQPKKPRVIWDEAMVASAREWVRHNLDLIGFSNIEFTTSIAGNNLKFQFNNMITGDINKERLLFSSFAYLILSTLRNKYNKSLPHLRVVLKS